MVERGERTFAAGDRVMFLRNERGLGVKNGTLGKIREVSPERMAVELDGGRRVAFELKDYAHVDHGYAATIHKAKGVTVDRAYVLATPGMHRHAAYVALSRHRDGVQLHYGRDEFADRDRLVRTLSRDRAKDMAGDYPGAQSAQEQARAFAERREIRWPERVVEAVREAVATVQAVVRTAVQATVKSAIKGGQAELKLEPPEPKAAAIPVREPVAVPVSDAAKAARIAVESERIARLARAIITKQMMTGNGWSIPPEQRQEFEAAGKGVEGIKPGTLIEVTRVFARDPQLLQNSAQGETMMTVRAVMEGRRALSRAIEQAGLSRPETVGAEPVAVPTSDPASLLNGSLDSKMIARFARAMVELRNSRRYCETLKPYQDKERHDAFDAVDRTDPGIAWAISRAFDQSTQRLLDAAEGQTASTVAAVIAERNQRSPDSEQYRVPLPERQMDWG